MYNIKIKKHTAIFLNRGLMDPEIMSVQCLQNNDLIRKLTCIPSAFSSLQHLETDK